MELDWLVTDLGSLSRHDALQLQFNSDILLSATWNSRGSTGVVTGKMPEYMMMNKPVITVVSGDLPDSAAKVITRTCGLGFCYEESMTDVDFPKLKDYLALQYSSFRSTGQVVFEPVSDEVRQFEYQRIIRRLTELLDRPGFPTSLQKK